MLFTLDNEENNALNEGGRADTGTCPGCDGHENIKKKNARSKGQPKVTLGMMKRGMQKTKTNTTMQMVAPEAPEAPSQGEINLSLNKGVDIFTLSATYSSTEWAGELSGG